MPRKTLTDKGVGAIRPRAKTFTHSDPQQPGHYIRVMPTGVKSYLAVTRDPRGKQVWTTIGKTSELDIEQARVKAREVIAAVKAGQDKTGPQTFQAVAEHWFKRHVEASALRSATHIRTYLDKHLLPAWGGREFTSIKRVDVAALMDEIEDTAGPVAADRAMHHFSAIATWYATRNDDYSSPVIKGMRRSKPKERARFRILSDEELKAVWTAAEGDGTFGALVQLLLLTAQRKATLQTMRWQDVSVDGVWTIPTEKRQKGTAKEVQLPPQAIKIIQAQPRYATNPYVFAGRSRYLNGLSKCKAAFEAKLPEEMPQWGLHDLRRTARSLMARAGVQPLVAELVLGHAQRGVQGIYDRHQYQVEKGKALRELAAQIDSIIRPETKMKMFA